MREKFIEYAFFFGLLGLVAYLVLLILFPFISALVLSAIIATVCHPMYQRILRFVSLKRKGLASFIATLVVFLVVVIPLGVLSYLLFLEAASFYSTVSKGQTLSFAPSIEFLEDFTHQFAPDFEFDFTSYAKQGAEWLTTSIGTLFASTASTALLLFIAFIGLYYLFKDGERFVKTLIRLSPLPDSADTKIIDRLSQAVRSVVLGTLTVGLIQGTLTAIGFTIFGIPQAILWGLVTAIAALIPAVGTSLIFIPTVAILLITGSYTAAIGIAIWGVVIVGLVDNFLGPYLISRRSTLHPFLILISALGGLSLFGPIGFILGPVVMSLFIALLDLYQSHIMKGN